MKNIKFWLVVGLCTFVGSSGLWFWQVFYRVTAGPSPDTLYSTITELEIADTYSSREIGLMNRKNLCESCAMLFVFQKEEPQSFWMKNTLISLDIVFMDSTGIINAIHENTTPQQTFPTYNSTKPSLYVLETNAFFSRKISLQPLQKVDIERLRKVSAKTF
jgi:uncharacterized membrane protein (UPF0127 family)